MHGCKHCLGLSQNEIGETIAFCEEWDEGRNVTLGACFGNCEDQEVTVRVDVKSLREAIDLFQNIDCDNDEEIQQAYNVAIAVMMEKLEELEADHELHG